MTFDGVSFNKVNGGMGRTNPTDDNEMALIYVVPIGFMPDGVTHYTTYRLLQPSDANPLGFTAAYDANRATLIRHTIERFFKYAPTGVLQLIPVPSELTPVQIMASAAVKAAIRTADKVKGIAIGGTLETTANLFTMVEGVQAQVNAFAAEHRRIDFVILQGNGPGSGSVSVSAYNDFRTKVAPNVCVSIAQDPFVARIGGSYRKYADVGSVLGMAAARQVNEDWGSVDIKNKTGEALTLENYPLKDGDYWADAALSDGTPVSTLSAADKQSLTDKALIFAGSYAAYPGTYLNGCPTCVEAASDYAYANFNRVWNKASRLLRSALLPRVKGTYKKDPKTGYIAATAISVFQLAAQKALDRMVTADEISGYTVYIDPKQAPSDQAPLKIKGTVICDGIVHEFVFDLGLQ